MKRRKVDSIVIGSGQGGVPLAVDLAKDGQDVVIFERSLWGGCCLNYGCTPSKMLLASAHAASEAENAGELGIWAEIRVDFPAVMKRINQTTTSWSEGSATRLKDAGVETIHKEAFFVGPRSVSDGDEIIEAENIIINTGKSPFIPPIEGVENTPYLTYETIWQLKELPERLIIVGGGYVGCELGQSFAQLGSQVHLIHSHSLPLSREEPAVGNLIKDQLEADGVRFYLDNRAEGVEYHNGRFVVSLAGGETVEGESLLIATGRKPNTGSLKPAAGEINLDENGHIIVDEHLKTTAEGVYAIGDVTGQPAFTHVSWEDYRRIKAILHGEDRTQMDRVLGYTIFTRPQIGRAGLSLSQAREQGFAAEQVELPLNQVARATEVGFTRGFYKMVIDKATDKILGATLASPSAGELIHVFIAHMESGSTWQVLDQSVHIHPTFAEGLPSLARQFEK